MCVCVTCIQEPKEVYQASLQLQSTCPEFWWWSWIWQERPNIDWRWIAPFITSTYFISYIYIYIYTLLYMAILLYKNVWILYLQSLKSISISLWHNLSTFRFYGKHALWSVVTPHSPQPIASASINPRAVWWTVLFWEASSWAIWLQDQWREDNFLVPKQRFWKICSSMGIILRFLRLEINPFARLTSSYCRFNHCHYLSCLQ